MAFGKILRPVFDPGLAVAPWWKVAGKTCLAAYQPKGAASLAASYVNLANPGTYDAAPGVAPTWAAATGWAFNGGTQYLDTGIVPASGWSMLVRYSTTFNYDAFLVGSTDGANAAFYLERWFVATHAIFYGNGGSSGKYNIPNSYGVIGVAGNRGYCDGIDVGVTIPPWSGVTTYQIILGGRNNGGTLELRPSTIAALIIYSAVLTAGEVATVSAVMATL